MFDAYVVLLACANRWWMEKGRTMMTLVLTICEGTRWYILRKKN